jgi:transcriptional accessory protein Tex/SPT6
MKKSQKPIEIDAHFKYGCPNTDCHYDHWLSLKETQTKNFKVVCDCGCVFKPKQISKIKISFVSEVKTKPPEKVAEVAKVIEKPKIGIDLQAKCVKLLCEYGFTRDESIILVDKAFEKNPTNEAGLLIKYVLQNLGELNVNN